MSQAFQYLDALQQLKRAVTEAVEHGEANRCADILIDFQGAYPAASGLIKALFTGTPAQVVEKAAGYFPAVKSIPNAERFAAELHKLLWDFWTKKRGASPAPEGRRLKG